METPASQGAFTRKMKKFIKEEMIEKKCDKSPKKASKKVSK